MCTFFFTTNLNISFCFKEKDIEQSLLDEDIVRNIKNYLEIHVKDKRFRDILIVLSRSVVGKSRKPNKNKYTISSETITSDDIYSFYKTALDNSKQRRHPMY